MNYYKRHIGDYTKKTRMLTVYEHGVYTLLLDLYYTDERPLSRDDAYGVCRASTARDRMRVDKILGRYFVQGNDGLLYNSRADEEIAQYHAKAMINKKNGLFGGRPKKTQSVISGNPEKTQTVTQTKPRNNPIQNPIATNGIKSLSSDTPPPTDNPPTPDTLSGEQKRRSPDPSQTLIGQAREVLEFLNSKTGKNFQACRPSGKPTSSGEMVMNLLRDKYTVQQIRTVTARKCSQWASSDKMAEYLRPVTLYRKSNFDNYLGECTQTNPLRTNGDHHNGRKDR